MDSCGRGSIKYINVSSKFEFGILGSPKCWPFGVSIRSCVVLGFAALRQVGATVETRELDKTR